MSRSDQRVGHDSRGFLLRRPEVLALFVASLVEATVAALDLTGALDNIPWLKARIPAITLLALVVATTAILTILTRVSSRLTLQQDGIAEALGEAWFERVDQQIARHTGTTVSEVFGDTIDSSVELLKSLIQSGSFVFTDIESYPRYYRRMLIALPGTAIDATSIPTNRFFWGDEAVLSAISAFVARGGKMRRVFFIDSNSQLDADTEAYRILREQHQAGVTVFTAIQSRVPHDLRRYFLYADDNRIGWESRLGPDGSISRLEVVSDHQRIAEYRGLFTRLLHLECVSQFPSETGMNEANDPLAFEALLLFPWVGETAVEGRTPCRA